MTRKRKKRTMFAIELQTTCLHVIQWRMQCYRSWTEFAFHLLTTCCICIWGISVWFRKVDEHSSLSMWYILGLRPSIYVDGVPIIDYNAAERPRSQWPQWMQSGRSHLFRHDDKTQQWVRTQHNIGTIHSISSVNCSCTCAMRSGLDCSSIVSLTRINYQHLYIELQRFAVFLLVDVCFCSCVMWFVIDIVRFVEFAPADRN